MDKDRLKRLAGNPQFISGIYNYCDRWCERCPFTSRCLNFAMSEEQFDDPASRDMENEKFWETLSETFRMTLDMVKEMAEAEGIDLEATDMEEIEEEDRLKNDISESHICCREANRYAHSVKEWFDSADRFLQDYGESENGFNATFALPGIDLNEPMNHDDAVQVIRWYQYFIHVKLLRAVRGKLDDDAEALDGYQKDSDGSAKIALIGIDRSMAAWGEMRSHFLARQDDILRLITLLERLRRSVEAEFPNARSFIRPGFDKIKIND